MRHHSSVARIARACVLAITVVGFLPSTAIADNIIADGDGVTPVSASSISLGTICVGTSITRPVALAIKRDGGAVNQQFANGASVAVSQTPAPSAADLTATQPSPSSITLPANWETIANNTLSSASFASVTYAPSAATALSTSVGYSATGARPGGGTTTRTTSMPVSATASSCDTTPPVITPVVSGTLGNAGWYVSNVTVNWTVTDPDSAISSTTGCGTSVVLIDTTGTTYTCNATSVGGTASNAVTIKRDATAPTGLSASPSRPFDASPNWYNAPFSVSWSGTDATSTIASCSTNIPYSGPDTSSGSLTGSCTDVAGNSASSSFLFQYDTTVPDVIATPSALANVNGWYNAAPTVTWSSSDAGAVCSSASTYTGLDSLTATINGTCTDAAGNVGSGSFTFQYDATPPSASVAADRLPDHNGWYNAAVTATWTGTDNLSQIASCTAPATHANADGDTTTGSLSGTCTDLAGNTSDPATFNFQYDATPPVASAALSRAADSNGWYNHPVTASWTGTDNLSTIESCSSPVEYSGPAAANVNLSGQCTDSAGNVSLDAAVSFAYDATPPEISFTGRTPANEAGWNNDDVTVTWSCADDPSGPTATSVSKTVTSQGLNQSVTGTCTDAAGNSASNTVKGINIDTKPPTITKTSQTPANAAGWNNTDVTVVWSCADNLSGPVKSGVSATLTDQGTGQSVLGTCVDRAGNEVGNKVGGINIDKTAPTIAITAPFGNYVLNGPNTAAFTCGDNLSGVVSCSGPATFDVSSIGSKTYGPVTASDLAGNGASSTSPYSVQYAGSSGTCLGSPSHTILQPINADGSSVFKKGSTVPAKFRVCDANGNSIGTAGVVQSFKLTSQTISTGIAVNEDPASTTPDTAFRWSSTDQQWIFNISTKNLSAGNKYGYTITLNDSSTIEFAFSVK